MRQTPHYRCFHAVDFYAVFPSDVANRCCHVITLDKLVSVYSTSLLCLSDILRWARLSVSQTCINYSRMNDIPNILISTMNFPILNTILKLNYILTKIAIFSRRQIHRKYTAVLCFEMVPHSVSDVRPPLFTYNIFTESVLLHL